MRATMRLRRHQIHGRDGLRGLQFRLQIPVLGIIFNCNIFLKQHIFINIMYELSEIGNLVVVVVGALRTLRQQGVYGN
jgi:hypothetical protein